jgi:transposase
MSVQGRNAVPDPEVPERAKRRRFTAEYKLKILGQADQCTKPGELGALLRREGLYHSSLTEWRRERDRGALASLDKARGRKPTPALEVENTRLRRQNQRLAQRLSQAEKVIEVQGKVSALLRELTRESAGAEPEQ